MENGNASYGYLDHIAVRPYTNGGRNMDGTWNEGLTWVFEKHPESTKSDGSYSRNYNIRVDKPDETLYIQVFVIDNSGYTGVVIPSPRPGLTVTPGSIGGGGLPEPAPTTPVAPTTPTTPAAPAVPELKSFSDVSSGRWSHDAIMEMVDLGMFAGTTTPDANGVGSFNPTGTMTKIQYIVVMTRYLYGDELSALPAGAMWYSNNYDLAVKYGLITEDEFSIQAVNAPLTRQEMALIAVRTATAQGEAFDSLVSTNKIADYATVDAYYKDYVRQAFSMGLISGYDDYGTFGPGDTLTREQGAMVAYRLVNPSARKVPA